MPQSQHEEYVHNEKPMMRVTKLRTRNRPISHEELLHAIELYSNNRTMKETKYLSGVSPAVIARVLKACGFKVNSAGHACHLARAEAALFNSARWASAEFLPALLEYEDYIRRARAHRTGVFNNENKFVAIRPFIATGIVVETKSIVETKRPAEPTKVEVIEYDDKDEHEIVQMYAYLYENGDICKKFNISLQLLQKIVKDKGMMVRHAIVGAKHHKNSEINLFNNHVLSKLMVTA